MRLKPADIPGFEQSKVDDAGDIEVYGWWRRSNTAQPPEYVGIEDGLRAIAEVIAAEGPFDGVIGFSQGACLAGMVASLLEGTIRRETFKKFHSESPLSIPFSSSFDSLRQPPLKFCVPYSGFIAPGERYKAFYEQPHISTPSLHFIGSLDSVVEESRCRALIDACGGEPKVRVVYHPGGHFIPSSKPYLEALVQFIRAILSTSAEISKVEEEKVEDMEVPF